MDDKTKHKKFCEGLRNFRNYNETNVTNNTRGATKNYCR